LQREGAAVRETIERATAGVAARFDAVFRLIEEGPRLLAFEQVGGERDLAFEEFDRTGRVAAQHALALREALVCADADVVALDDRARVDELLQKVGEEVATRVGGFDQGLHAEAVGVAIDDQAGEEIGLAVDEASCAAALRIRHDRVAQPFRLRQAAREESVVDRFVLAREQPHRDLALRAVEGLADEPAAFVGEPDHFSAGERFGRAEIGAVDPDVALVEPFDRPAREDDGGLVGGSPGLADAAEHRRRTDRPRFGRLTKSPAVSRAHVAHGAGAVLDPLLASCVLRRFRGLAHRPRTLHAAGLLRCGHGRTVAGGSGTDRARVREGAAAAAGSRAGAARRDTGHRRSADRPDARAGRDAGAARDGARCGAGDGRRRRAAREPRADRHAVVRADAGPARIRAFVRRQPGAVRPVAAAAGYARAARAVGGAGAVVRADRLLGADRAGSRQRRVLAAHGGASPARRRLRAFR